MKLVLKNTSGETVSLVIYPHETFEDLKKRVQAEVGIILEVHDLLVKGRPIKDNVRVIEYFSKKDSTVQGVQDVPGVHDDVKCAVPTCENTKSSCPEKAFFMFPMEEMRCHQWALYCHRLNDATGKHRLMLSAHSVVCADHFRPDQFVKNSLTLLKRTAVPCINPEIPMSSVTKPSELPAMRRRQPLRSSLMPSLTMPLPLSSLESALTLLQQTAEAEEENTAFCRLCSSSCSNFVFIFDEIGKKLKVAEKINACLPVTVKETDLLPKQVCRTCVDKLTVVSEMAETCLKAEERLRSMVESKQFSSQTLEAADLLNPIVGELDDAQEICGNTENTKSLFCCPLCSCGKMITKSGIYRVNDNLCQDMSEEDPTSALEEKKEESMPESSMKTEKHVHIDQQESTKDENEENNKLSNDQHNLWNGQEYSLKIPELDMEHLYTDPDSIVGMELDSIPEEEDWDGLGGKKETKVVVKGEKDMLVCRLCGIEFSEVTALLDHAEDHSDIDCFPCTVCDQWFCSKDILDTHFMESHFGHPSDNLYTCEICGVTFKSVFKLESHVCGSNTGSNRCPHCNKSFRSEARLKFHQRFHEGARVGYCEICKKTFVDELKLYKHVMYLHSKNKGHCCEECGKVFRSNSSLRYHQRSHQGEDIMKPYPCEYCGKCFIRKSMLRNHFLNTHKDKSQEGSCFTCKICFEAFPSTDHAVSHMDVMHIPECTGETTYSFEMHTVKRLYLCEYCERCFTDSVSLNTHRERHPAGLEYQCKLCNEAFSTAALLEDHKRLHLSNGMKDYTVEFSVPTVFMCEYCERCFISSIKLSEHLTVHFGEEPYHCRFCDMRFKTQADATHHRLTHDQSLSPVDDSYRPYECHYCPKSFSIEDALVKHIRMHTGEKPFICDQCGKGFSQSSGLYTHQKVHSDERPYNCPVCPRTFKIKGDRDVHVRKHSGDRPYKCDFCGKAFMTQHVYSQHRKIHTGERPYKCDVCGIAFRRSHVLTVHKRIHTGEKPNICDICGKRYRQKGDMLKHRRLQHGIVKVRIQKIEF